MLFDFLINSELNVLNKGEATRMQNALGNISVPDVTIASPDIGILLSWSTIKDLHGSNHYPAL